MKYFCKKKSDYGTISVWPKDVSFPYCLSFNIAGLTFRDNIDKYIGENVGTLEAEPTNDYDPNAIKILAKDGHHVGYVPKDTTETIRYHTQLPCKCYFYIGKYKDGEYKHLFSCAYILL